MRLTGASRPASGLADLGLDDTELAGQAGQLRVLLEAAYWQRFTVRVEQRDPAGTRVSVTQVPGDVAGDVPGVAPGASADVHEQATTVRPGGSVTGFEGNIGR